MRKPTVYARIWGVSELTTLQLARIRRGFRRRVVCGLLPCLFPVTQDLIHDQASGAPDDGADDHAVLLCVIPPIAAPAPAPAPIAAAVRCKGW